MYPTALVGTEVFSRPAWAITTTGDPEARFDTSVRGLSKAAHTFGDALSPTERARSSTT